MSENNRTKKIINQSGVFHDLGNHVKLVFRLMGDRRVSSWLKLIPIGTLAYLVLPLDFDFALMYLDDAAIIAAGLYLFVELCPPEVVEEHRKALTQTISADMHDSKNSDNVVDADFREIK